MYSWSRVHAFSGRKFVLGYYRQRTMYMSLSCRDILRVYGRTGALRFLRSASWATDKIEWIPHTIEVEGESCIHHLCHIIIPCRSFPSQQNHFVFKCYGWRRYVFKMVEQGIWVRRPWIGINTVTISVWKSGPRTGKRPGLDWTRTSQDRKSQDRTGLQPQSGLRSFAILRIPGPVKDRSGPVRTSLLIGKFINILSIFRTLIY